MLCKTEKRPESSNIFIPYKFIFENNEVKVPLYISNSDRPIIFSIDTGAQISILKPTKLFKDGIIKSSEKIFVSGVTEGEKIRTLGTIDTDIKFSGFKIPYKFHVLNAGFRLKTDGILGADFLRKFGASINFANSTIGLHIKIDSYNDTEFSNHAKPTTNPLLASVKTNAQNKTRQNIAKIDKFPKRKDFYELISNDYFNQEKFEEKIAKKIEIEPCDVYDCFSVKMINVQNEISNPIDRANILFSKANLNENSAHQKEIIKNLLLEFSDAFYVQGDIFVPSNIYQHRLRLKPNSPIVHIKQYRLPCSDQIEIERQIQELLHRGIVERSTSPYNSPAFLVKKPPTDENKTAKRLVLDYKELNKVCYDQYFSLPIIDDVTNKMHGSKIFTKLDVRGAYHHVQLHKDSRPLTAFSTSKGHYQFRCVPFGIQSGPVAWNFTANILFSEFINDALFAYVDDLLSHAKTINEQIKLLKHIFKKLIKHNIKLNIEKCLFFQTEVRYLGFKFTTNGLKADERKTFCINNFPVPKNLKQTQRFIGMCSFYRRFVPKFSNIASELYKLCKKDKEFEWTDACQKAFENLKEKLSTPPVLAYPDLANGIFVLMCDASQVAAAGVLNIKNELGIRPVEYFSRGFNETQAKYHSNELEILALVWSVEWFRVYLYGREKFFIHTDNNAVKYLFANNHTKSRIHRWRWALLEYNFEVVHRKGVTNNVADALSRVKIDNPFDEPSQTVFQVKTRSMSGKNDANAIQPPKDYFIDEFSKLLIDANEFDHIFYFFDSKECTMIKELQHKTKMKITINDFTYGKIYEIDKKRSFAALKNSLITDDHQNTAIQCFQLIAQFCQYNNLANIAFNIECSDAKSYFPCKACILDIFRPLKLKITLFLCKIVELTDINDINETLKLYHLTPLGGHMSFERMYNTIRRCYNWHQMKKDIKAFCKNCDACQRNKVSTKAKQPMQISSTASKAMQVISFDHCGRINPSTPRSNAYILILQCTLTKYVFTFPVPDVSADTTSRMLVENVFMLFGIPETIVSDCHASFIGEVFKKIEKMLHIKHVFTSPYSPSSNEVERKNRELGNYLRIFTEKNPTDWDIKLPYFMANQNSVVHSSTNYSPFQLMFGRQFTIPSTLMKKPSPIYTYDDFADELKLKISNTWQWARENIVKRKEYNQTYYDEKNRTKDLNVSVGNSVYLKNHKKPYKFSSLYSGPFVVDEVTGPNSVVIKKGNKKFRVHKNNLKLAADTTISSIQDSRSRSFTI